MTVAELKAWVGANVFTTNNRLNTGTSFREVLYKVVDETYGAVHNKADLSGAVFTGAVNFTGKIGVNVASPNGDLQFGNVINNRKIVLWEQANNEHEYYGFGLNSGVLRYQVDNPGADHVFYVGNVGGASSSQLFRIRGNGNVIVGGLADNGLAKFQTPSISLGLNNWQYASDGTERLFYGSAITYHRVASGGVMIMMFGSGENYNLTHNVFGLNNDSFSDISQFALTGAPSAVSRQWVHRKESSGVDYRFFDWNGSTSRDWWNVYASTLKMSLAQIIHANYGSNVGIGTSTPDTSAILDLKSNTKGLLLPQLTTTERNAVPVSAARKGLVIFNTTTNKINVYNGSGWEAVTSA